MVAKAKLRRINWHCLSVEAEFAEQSDRFAESCNLLESRGREHGCMSIRLVLAAVAHLKR